MRSMIISLCFFILSVTAVSVNSRFVTSYLGETLTLLEEMPCGIESSADKEACKTQAKEITEKWNKHYGFLSLSINIAELRDCTIALESFLAYTEADDPSDYSSGRSEAILRIRTLYLRERISLENII